MKLGSNKAQTWQELCVAGGGLAVCLGILIYAYWVNEENRSENAQAKQRLFQIRQVQQKSASDIAALADLKINYQAIANSQFNSPINPKKRAKLLLDIGKALYLDEIHYEFQIQESDKESPAFVHQRMKVQLSLVHEGDLLRFLEALHERAPSMLIVRHCQLSRTSGSGMRAECEIDWIQFDENAA